MVIVRRQPQKFDEGFVVLRRKFEADIFLFKIPEGASKLNVDSIRYNNTNVNIIINNNIIVIIQRIRIVNSYLYIGAV